MANAAFGGQGWGLLRDQNRVNRDNLEAVALKSRMYVLWVKLSCYKLRISISYPIFLLNWVCRKRLSLR